MPRAKIWVPGIQYISNLVLEINQTPHKLKECSTFLVNNNPLLKDGIVRHFCCFSKKTTAYSVMK